MRPRIALCSRCGRRFQSTGSPFCTRECFRAWRRETRKDLNEDYDYPPDEIERRFQDAKRRAKQEQRFRLGDGWDGWRSGLVGGDS